MGNDLPLPPRLKQAGWKVKVYQNEVREPPHVTILSPDGTKWRWDLRQRAFMDHSPPPHGVHRDLVRFLRANWAELVSWWDSKHPDNPVGGGQ
jgi:hypothetical protein